MSIDVLIQQVQKELSVTLPRIYIHYLAKDGETNEYLYPADELVEVNLTDEVPQYAPGYIMIGSDAGDLRYLMKSGPEETAVYEADVGDMNPENFSLVADDLAVLLREGFPETDDSESEYPIR